MRIVADLDHSYNLIKITLIVFCISQRFYLLNAYLMHICNFIVRIIIYSTYICFSSYFHIHRYLHINKITTGRYCQTSDHPDPVQ